MRAMLRTIGRLLFFPVIILVGAIIGVIGILLHSRQVIQHVRERRGAIFESFTPEERKVIRHILLGFLWFAILGAAVALWWRSL